jgi:hypothetical protein
MIYIVTIGQRKHAVLKLTELFTFFKDGLEPHEVVTELKAQKVLDK